MARFEQVGGVVGMGWTPRLPSRLTFPGRPKLEHPALREGGGGLHSFHPRIPTPGQRDLFNGPEDVWGWG